MQNLERKTDLILRIMFALGGLISIGLSLIWGVMLITVIKVDSSRNALLPLIVLVLLFFLPGVTSLILAVRPPKARSGIQGRLLIFIGFALAFGMALVSGIEAGFSLKNLLLLIGLVLFVFLPEVASLILAERLPKAKSEIQDRLKPTLILQDVLSVLFAIVLLLLGVPLLYAMSGMRDFGGPIFWFLGLIWLSAAIVCAILVVHRLWIVWQFKKEIATVSALVIDRNEYNISEGSTPNYRYTVTVQFATSEKTVTLKAEVSEKMYQDLQPGAQTRVEYADAEPRIALLGDEIGSQT